MLDLICRYLSYQPSLRRRPLFRMKKTRQLMLLLLMLVVTCLMLLLLLPNSRRQQPADFTEQSMEIQLPQASAPSQRPGAYLCTSVSLQHPSNASAIRPIFIVEFEPLVPKLRDSAVAVHHMLLAECNELPRGAMTDGRGWWNCGFGHRSSDVSTDGEEDVSGKNSKEMCAARQRYLFAYSSNAATFRLPRGVAMPAGDSPHNGGAHLVLQVHYSTNEKQVARHQPEQRGAPARDSQPGLRLRYLSERIDSYRMAGVHLSLATGPAASSRLIAGCEYTGDSALRPFALRVHTHSTGRLVSVYRVRRPPLPQNPMLWSLIGQADPRLPQAFYATNATELVLRPGDLVTTACAMDAVKDATAKTETCNAWLAYWVENSDSFHSKHDGPESGENKIDLRHMCADGSKAASIWSEAPDWVVKQASAVFV